jgi:hypothetical protein
LVLSTKDDSDEDEISTDESNPDFSRFLAAQNHQNNTNDQKET